MEIKQFTHIDLFAGCGGLSLGLHNAGWKGIFAIEKSSDAFETLKYNLVDNKQHFDWPSWLPIENLEIDNVLERYRDQLIGLRDKVDLVAGGPPCQGFSTAGMRNEDDVRNGLIRSYLKFILYVKPKLIFFENVKGFTLQFKKNKTKGKSYSLYVTEMLTRMGYQVYGQLVDFSKFGIPQKRTRFILVGIRKDLAKNSEIAKSFFRSLKANKKHFLLSKNLPQAPCLSNAISDLLKSHGLVPTDDRKGGFQNGVYGRPESKYQRYLRDGVVNSSPNSHSYPKHKPAVVKRFRVLLKKANNNKSISKALKERLDISKHTIIPLLRSKPAPTLTTLPDDYIHYSEPRILTVREYARVQSFPDWFEIQGKYTTGGKMRKMEVPRYTQIGNAIPPLFGEQSGLILKFLLQSIA